MQKMAGLGSFLIARATDTSAAAATASAATASAASGERLRGAVARAVCRAEDGELQRVLFAGALWASDFLLFVEDNFFEMGLAIFADVFVNRHIGYLS
jgi:hypothetical protein